MNYDQKRILEVLDAGDIVLQKMIQAIKDGDWERAATLCGGYTIGFMHLTEGLRGRAQYGSQREPVSL